MKADQNGSSLPTEQLKKQSAGAMRSTSLGTIRSDPFPSAQSVFQSL
jgi:hypothetical protein